MMFRPAKHTLLSILRWDSGKKRKRLFAILLATAFLMTLLGFAAHAGQGPSQWCSDNVGTEAHILNSPATLNAEAGGPVGPQGWSWIVCASPTPWGDGSPAPTGGAVWFGSDQGLSGGNTWVGCGSDNNSTALAFGCNNSVGTNLSNPTSPSASLTYSNSVSVPGVAGVQTGCAYGYTAGTGGVGCGSGGPAARYSQWCADGYGNEGPRLIHDPVTLDLELGSSPGNPNYLLTCYSSSPYTSSSETTGGVLILDTPSLSGTGARCYSDGNASVRVDCYNVVGYNTSNPTAPSINASSVNGVNVLGTPINLPSVGAGTDCNSGTIAVSIYSCANGQYLGVSGTGNANGGLLAVSGTGCSGGNDPTLGSSVSGTNCAWGGLVGVSATGSAGGLVSAGGSGCTYSGYLGVNLTGCANSWLLAISGTGTSSASGYNIAGVTSPGAAISGTGTAAGTVLAASGTGCANASQAVWYEGGGVGIGSGQNGCGSSGYVAISGLGPASGGYLGVSGTSCSTSGTDAISILGCANSGHTAISVAGNATGDRWAFSVLGNANAGSSFAVSGLGSASAGFVAISGLGNANSTFFSISGVGGADGRILAISGTGSATSNGGAYDTLPPPISQNIYYPAIAVAGGNATGRELAVSGDGNSQGWLAISGLGSASGSGNGAVPGVAVSGGSADGRDVAVGGTGARGPVAVSATDSAEGGLVGVSGGGDASGTVAFSPNFVERQISFRKDFGLIPDPGIVSALISNPPSNPSQSEWGVILSDAEYAEMSRRMTVGQSVYTIRDDGLSVAPNEYAGVWMDHLDGGKVKVGYTSNLSQHLSRIQGFFPFPDQIQVVQRVFSFNQLKSVQDTIEWALSGGGLAGVPVVSTDIDEELNRVVVGVSFPTSSHEGLLISRFGPSVIVKHQLPGKSASGHWGRKDPWPTMRGGIAISPTSRPDGNGHRTWKANQCTLGFVWGGWAITAGHCAYFEDPTRPGDVGNDWWQPVFASRGREPISAAGSTTRVRIGGRVDAAAFPLRPGLATNCIFRDPKNKCRTITGRGDAARDYKGDPLLKAGITTDYAPGKLKSRNYCGSEYWSGRRICYLRAATPHIKHGDSGGPIFMGSVALGIISDFSSCDDKDCRGGGSVAYAHMENVLNALGL